MPVIELYAATIGSFASDVSNDPGMRNPLLYDLSQRVPPLA